MSIKDEKTNYELLNKVIELISVKELSEILSVNYNTIKRWLELKRVPWQYHIDLKKILNENINYTELTFDEKDQFFTSESIVEYCLNVVKTVLSLHNYDINDFLLLEPSAGDGAFFNKFPHNQKIGIDIEPRNKNIIQADFLSWYPEQITNPILTIGNPPFGLRGNLALRFVNHAAKFSDFVCFILPPFFDSDGKGNCMDRVEGLNLIYSEKIDNKFYNPLGQEIKVNSIFQIWSKNIKKEIYANKYSIICDDFVKIYSVTDGGTPSTTRNKKMIGNCDLYLTSTTFEKEKMTHYKTFDELPNKRGYGIKILKEKNKVFDLITKIDWLEKSFLATNSSYNLRTSLIQKALVDEGLNII